MADFSDVYDISAAGLQAQTQRIRTIAENIANANTTANSPNQQPYQRQVVTFKNEFDKAHGISKVKVSGVVKDQSPFGKRYEPSNPAADATGYVQTPNVKPLVESMDMREAQRTYEVNLSVIEASRVMMMRTLDLIR